VILLIEFIDVYNCELIIGDRPTALYLAYNYCLDVCSWELRPSEGREFSCVWWFLPAFSSVDAILMQLDKYHVWKCMTA